MPTADFQTSKPFVDIAFRRHDVEKGAHFGTIELLDGIAKRLENLKRADKDKVIKRVENRQTTTHLLVARVFVKVRELWHNVCTLRLFL